MDLKVGDIRKFKYQNGSEVVGVVLETTTNGILICSVKGEKYELSKFFVRNITITSTRLEPIVRGKLEEVAKEYLQIQKYEEEILKLRGNIKKQRELGEKKMKELMYSSGCITKSDFIDLFYKVLSSEVKTQLERKGYRVEYANIDKNIITIILSRDEDIEKYADERKYSFLGREYDNTIHIATTETSSYKNLVTRYSSSNINLTSKEPKLCKIEDRNGLSLGDKNWLSFYHEISIHFRGKDLTADNAKNMGKVLKLK